MERQSNGGWKQPADLYPRKVYRRQSRQLSDTPWCGATLCLTEEAKIRSCRYLGQADTQKLRAHLRQLGLEDLTNPALPPGLDIKGFYRGAHALQRKERLDAMASFVEARWPVLGEYFANGNEVNPACIEPRLEAVETGSWQADLFRLAALSWSVPVSQGYGRRMRFLIRDGHNGKLLGLLALTDPVFNLTVRDQWIGWNSEQRKQGLVNVMDACVLGALPPYNQLLCGKLVACLVRSREVRHAFMRRYRQSTGIISGKKKLAQLVVVTTSSALGRSSVYNRLRLGGQQYFEPVGYTEGWGHFHVPDALFESIRELLRLKKHPYASGHQFGDGPNWRLRTLRAGLTLLGMNPDLLRHGIKREVYACALAENAHGILRGQARRADFTKLATAAEIGALARERWIIPRAERNRSYLDWHRGRFHRLLLPIPEVEAVAPPEPMVTEPETAQRLVA